MSQRVLVLGGARSGKSTFAEERLERFENVRYIATSAPDENDPEWRERIAVHRSRRPSTWTTIESIDIADQVRTASPKAPVLVDCLTTWLTRRLDAAGAWQLSSQDRAGHRALRRRIDADIAELTDGIAACEGGLVLVSNEVGQGIVPDTSSGRMFRDLMGICNTRVAQVCDEVLLVVAGCPLTVKG